MKNDKKVELNEHACRDFNPKDFQVILGVILYSIRTDRGYNAGEVSEKTGISKANLSRIENGNVNTTISNIVKLCSLYQIGVGELFDTVKSYEGQPVLLEIMKRMAGLTEKQKQAVMTLLEEI